MENTIVQTMTICFLVVAKCHPKVHIIHDSMSVRLTSFAAWNSFRSSPELSQTKMDKNGSLIPLSPSQLWGAPTAKRRDVSWAATTQTLDSFSDRGTSFEDTMELPYSVCRDDTFVGRPKNGLSHERRRSFHDLGSLRDTPVLTPEQMRIDVELCGQMLIMIRRQEHLQNIISCLQVLESSLSTTSSILREDHDAHTDFMASLDPTSVFSDIDGEYKKAEEISQQTKTLMYESKQFNMADLWHAVNHSRQEVFELRDKAFGTGARRLPHGVRGAHGHFNRLQWTLDGNPRLVDMYGRTQKEFEEEVRADPDGQFSLPVTEEDEEDVVEHTSIKPMWLLRLFTIWGARWGAHATATQSDQKPAINDRATGTSSALELKVNSDITNVNKPSPADKSSD